jgi:anoctamin-10
MMIQSFNADFVLSVFYKYNNQGVTKEAQIDFNRLITTLDEGGFNSQVKLGNKPNNLLVFIKLNNYKFAELAEQDLIRNYEFGVTNSIVDTSSRLRIIYNYLITPKQFDGLGINGKNWNFVKSIFPVDQENSTKISFDSLSINDYIKKFGFQIGLYFEFGNYYFKNLIILSILGILTFLTHHHPILSLSYCFVNLIWGLIFICGWEKPQHYLTNIWGVENCHKIDKYYGELILINQKFEPESSFKHQLNFNDSQRFVKQLLFIPIGLVFTSILIIYQLFCFILEIFLSEIYNGPGKILLTLLPTIMITIFIPILSIIYNIVVDKVIHWENHDNLYSRNNSRLLKQFVLNFLTSYIPLIITSFIYLPFAHLIEPELQTIRSKIDENVNQSAFYYKYLIQLKKSEDFKINQQRLSTQYFYFIFTNQIIQLILKYAVPFLLNEGPKLYQKFINDKYKLTKSTFKPIDDPKESEWLNKIRDQEKLPTYDVNDDYRSLIIQYGYLIIFGPVWPLAPVVSLIFNSITLKLDSLKLTSGKFFKPPIPVRVDSIYPWNYAIFGLTWIGSIISPLITMFYRHGITPPKSLGQFALDKASIHISSTTKIVSTLFIAEHGFILLYIVFQKLYDLFKTDIEWNNDFTENDIKLRHDYYSGRVKPTFDFEDDKDNEKIWHNNVQDTIEQAKKLALLTMKQNLNSKADANQEDIDHKDSVGITTSTQKGDISGLTSRFNKNEEARLAQDRKDLNSVMDDQDEIVSSVRDGRTILSTIDNHGHIPIDHDNKPKKDLFKTSTSKPSSSRGQNVSASAFIGENSQVDPVPSLLNAQLNNATKHDENLTRTTGDIGDNLKTAAKNDPSTHVAPVSADVTQAENPTFAVEHAPTTAEPVTKTEIAPKVSSTTTNLGGKDSTFNMTDAQESDDSRSTKSGSIKKEKISLNQKEDDNSTNVKPSKSKSIKKFFNKKT